MFKKLITILFLVSVLSSGIYNTAAAGGQLSSETSIAGIPMSGLPNTARFGYGAWAQDDPINISRSLNSAKKIGVEWVSVTFDWAKVWPDPTMQLDLNPLLKNIQEAQNLQIYVMVSIQNPPAWAMTPTGPNPEYAAWLVKQIRTLGAENVFVFEMFPGANRATNWGAQPDPQAYAALINTCQQAISALHPLSLVIPSISPNTNVTDGEMGYLDYLSSFYQAFPEQRYPILGISLDELVSTATSDDINHYEQVRSVMLAANRRNEIIWITRFSWPQSLQEPQQQAEWIEQTLRGYKTQLYIGAAFFWSLNSPANSENLDNTATLINQNLKLSPAAQALKQLSAESAESSDIGMLTSPSQNNNQHHDLQGSAIEAFIRKILKWFGLSD